MNFIRKIAICSLTASLSAIAAATPLPEHQTSNVWYTDAQSKLLEKLQTNSRFKAKNVIVFIGDGMGISTLTSARILQGQLNDQLGEEGYLSFEKFPHTALVKTYNAGLCRHYDRNDVRIED
jgi:alkaline phosphatase